MTLATLVRGIVVVISATILAVGLFLLVDRFVPAKARRQHNDVAGFIYAFVGPLYAILLAFVVFVVWGYFDGARTSAVAEATAVYQVAYRSRSMGNEYFARVQRLAIRYGESVIDDEWPLMNQGQTYSVKTRQAFLALHDGVENYEPATTQQSDLFQQELSNLDELTGARNQRILKGQNALPPIFWVTLIVGAVLSVGYSFIFGLESRFAHSIMVALLTVLVTGMLVLIQAVDHPYRGDVRVQPTAMQETLNILRNPVQAP